MKLRLLENSKDDIEHKIVILIFPSLNTHVHISQLRDDEKVLGKAVF